MKSLKEIYKQYRNSVGLIKIQNGKQLSIRGTGFLVSKDGYFITCNHVFAQIPKEDLKYTSIALPGKENELKLQKYTDYKVTLVDNDIENDLALAKINDSDGIEFQYVDKFLKVDDVEVTDEVFFLGYPLATEMLMMGFGITQTFNKTSISCIKRRGADGMIHFYLIDTHTNKGSSGSPLFNEQGFVIGIVAGNIGQSFEMGERKFQIPANMGICRPADYIARMIDRNKK